MLHSEQPTILLAWGHLNTGQRIHVGMDEMYEIVHQATYRFFGIDEMYKLVMDEMHEIF